MVTLLTRWAKEAMCDKPLQEYPRPQMKRNSWLNLNGMYDFSIENGSVEWCEDYEKTVRVPFAIETCLSGICETVSDEERMWYRTKFTVDEKYKDKKAIIHFQAVDWQTEVFINKKPVGTHIGGYCPFEFDITDALIDGENELVVKVLDPTLNHWQNRGKQSNKSGGIWYNPTSGIWQTVWLEFVNNDYIKSYKITPDIDTKSLKIDTKIVGTGSLKIKVFDGDTMVVEKGINESDEIVFDDIKLWSPENPFLYTFTLELENGENCDTVEGYFGMRKYSIGEFEGSNRLFLNNKPYFQRGLLDQGYWSDGGMTAPTEEALIYDIATMKRLGFNMLRKHIKIENDRWYYHCDKLGMIVWQDMISGGSAQLNMFHAGVLPTAQCLLSSFGNFSKKDNDYKTFNREAIEGRSQFEEELYEMMEHLHNHTCIGCWVPFNEGWGQFDAKRISDDMKRKDPSRIIDHASGWFDQKGSDLRSLHIYTRPVNIPKYDGRPFVLSEYGGYSQKVDGHVWNKDKVFGYKIYKTTQALSQAYKKLHENQIIPAIKKGLSATVYTQVSDVEFEVNGVLTYDRELIKIDEKIIQDMNKKLVYDVE